MNYDKQFGRFSIYWIWEPTHYEEDNLGYLGWYYLSLGVVLWNFTRSIHISISKRFCDVPCFTPILRRGKVGSPQFEFIFVGLKRNYEIGFNLTKGK